MIILSASELGAVPHVSGIDADSQTATCLPQRRLSYEAFFAAPGQEPIRRLTQRLPASRSSPSGTRRGGDRVDFMGYGSSVLDRSPGQFCSHSNTRSAAAARVAKSVPALELNHSSRPGIRLGSAAETRRTSASNDCRATRSAALNAIMNASVSG